MEIIIDRLLSLEPFTLFMYLFMPITGIVFPIIRNILVKHGKSLKIWIICSFIPIVLCAVHLILNLYDMNQAVTFELFGLMYITALFFPLMTPLCKKKVLFHISAVVCALVIFCGSLISFAKISTLYVRTINYSHQSMTDSYRSVVSDLKKWYPLNEWKEIDYDAIDGEVYPMMEEAEKNNDYALYSKALNKLANSIPDGHVGSVATLNEQGLIKLMEEAQQDYFGLVMFTTDDGKTRAFCVEEDGSAYKAGIRSGTVITHWAGKPISEALAEINDTFYRENYPISENEDFVKPICLSGTGGKEVEVGFIDKDGKQKKVKLQRTDDYFGHGIEAYSRIMTSYNGDENFSSKMLTEDVGYLRISEENYDKVLDIKAYILGSYPEIEERVKSEIENLKSQGMKKLVIDLRCNAGGNPYISAAAASVFTDKKEIVLIMKGTAEHKANIEVRLSGDGTYKDLPVVALVNSNCGSSGDYLADSLSKIDNVKLVGMTPSMGIGQAVGERCMLPGGCEFFFPIIHTFNADNELGIDPRADRICRVPLEEKIPATEELIRDILEGSGDPELDYVVNNCF